jgi:hypothetical protein
MTTKNSVIEKMQEKFPARIQIINELFEESESFRTLCEDYMDCQSVIERLRYNLKMMEKDTLQEYVQLSGELEEEIICRIKSESDIS